MNPEIWHSLEAIAAFLVSGTFAAGIVRMSFYFGKLVKGQEQITKEAITLGEQLKEFGHDIREAVAALQRGHADHESRIVEIRTEMDVRSEMQPLLGRRATDPRIQESR